MTALELGDIQGNVLRGYGHEHAAHLPVRVIDARSGRRLVRDLLPGVTTAAPWAGAAPVTTLNVAVSYSGLSRLSVDADQLRTFPAEFRQGMQARAEQELRDVGASHPAHWEQGLRAGEIHLLLSVYGRDPRSLDERLAIVSERIHAGGDGLVAGSLQRTDALKVDGSRREHFGYADGFGQPSIRGVAGPAYPGQGVPVSRRRPKSIAWRPVEAGEFILGCHDEDGVPAPAPAAPLGRNGTFMVLRKLEQDVVAFRRLLRDVAQRHYSGDVGLAAAKIVGRWPDGTPLVLSPQHPDAAVSGAPERVNDFRFGDDERGHRCPLGAHIRRANPRDGLAGKGERTRRHRILRRGMPYGPWLPEGQVDDRSRGLLFICYQASIVRQFEVVNRWCVQGSVIGVPQDRDYLTDGPADGMTIQGDPPVFIEGHEPLVRTRGGEYLFLPGMTALTALATERGPARLATRRTTNGGAR